MKDIEYKKVLGTVRDVSLGLEKGTVGHAISQNKKSKGREIKKKNKKKKNILLPELKRRKKETLR